MTRPVYRFLRLVAKATAGIIAVAVVLGAVLVWRLSASPMTSNFFTPAIENAIGNMLPGTKTTIANTLLTWDNADRSITLHADGIKLSGKSGQQIADVPTVDIRVSIINLIWGQLVPSTLRIDHPQVWLTRAPDGTLLFGGMAAEGGESDDAQSDTINIADRIVHTYFMRRLQITRAIFTVHDLRAGGDWAMSVPEISLERSLTGGLSGMAKVEVTQRDQISTIALHYEHDPIKGEHELSASFAGIVPAFFALPAGADAGILDLPLTGRVSLELDDDFGIASGKLDIHGDEGALVDPDLWDGPRAVKSLDLKGGFSRGGNRFEVSDALIDFGGPKLALTAEGTPSETQHDLDFDAALTLSDLPLDDYAKIWPKPVIPGAYAWIAASLSKGKFDHGTVSLKGRFDWDHPDAVQVTEATGKISASGVTVKYLDGMPAVENVGADAQFDLDHMTVDVTGAIGDVKLMPSTIELTDFQKDTQNIVLPLKISGPIPDVLRIIDAPPLHYAAAIGLAPDAVTGAIDGTVELRFPLLNDLLLKNIGVKASAAITDLASSKLIEGLDISQGNFALDLDAAGFALKGTAAFDKVPLQVSWQEAFEASAGKPLRQIDVTGDVTGPEWDGFGISALAKTKGVTALSLHVTQKDKSMTAISGMLDMKAAEMNVDELGWKKPADVPSMLSFAAEMLTGKSVDVKSITLQGPQANIKGAATLAAGSMDLLALTLNPMTIGRTDATLRFSQQPGPQGALVFDVSGRSFDVSGLRGGKDPERSDPRPKQYKLKLDKLYTGDAGFIADAHGTATRDPQGWSAISLHGIADGKQPLDMELTPQPDGRRIFWAGCEDFGEALKGLGFTDTVKGGKLQINGKSAANNPRTIDGTVKVGHFTVSNLPALVTLMNATSPTGLFNLFNGSMDFDHLDGKFHWHGDTLGLDNVRAAGSAAGITVGGKVDMNSGVSDLRGAMAPFSMFNRILGAIPLIGDMITGGEGQGVLAVAYTVKGPLDNPDVSVNPVSLLTPGFLRNLFFNNDASDDNGILSPQPAPSPTNMNINK